MISQWEKVKLVFVPCPFPKDSNISDSSYTVTAVEEDASRGSSRRRVKEEKVAYTKVAGTEGQGARQARVSCFSEPQRAESQGNKD